MFQIVSFNNFMLCIHINLSILSMQQTKEEQSRFGDQIDEVVENVKNANWHTSKAVVMLLLGTIVAAVVADPLVDAVDNFSTATSIPSFFVSFVILPFVSSSEIVSTLIFVSRKKQRTASLAYSEVDNLCMSNLSLISSCLIYVYFVMQIYGSVTMSNILSLAVFLALVYIRNLTWSFSSEVLVIIIVCILMGVIASFRTTFPIWMCFVAVVLYPLSLLLVYILEYVIGWS